MTDKILKALSDLGIKNWIINSTNAQRHELFMILKRQDMLRKAAYAQTQLTVYRDFEANGEKMLGSSSVIIYPLSGDAEIKAKLALAYENALNVKNRFFELPEPVVSKAGKYDGMSPEDMLYRAKDALYKSDTGSESFINSAEIFASVVTKRILTSKGADVEYVTPRLKGEFVTQCKQPRDVELYTPFDYAVLDEKAISALSEKALERVKDRANALKPPVSGKYSVILTEENLKQLLMTYMENADASYVYPGYSKYTKGTDVYKGEVTGERLTMDVFSRAAFSFDGIPMPARPLLKDGVVQGIYGDTRFCRYLGIEPTGSYDCISVKNGTMPLDEMKNRRVLMPVVFSDFSCDALRGSFAGEIRLAYLFEDGNVKLITGGSISGMLPACQGAMKFSSERYKAIDYDGPAAALIPDVSVAGE